MKRQQRKEKAGPGSSIQKEIDQDRLAIEVINDNIDDGELLEFTRAFLWDFQFLPRLPDISLLTPEEARNAAAMLEERKKMLDQKLRAVGLLKKLLQKRAPGNACN